MINLGTAVGTLALDASNFNATLEQAYDNVAGLDSKFGMLSGGLGVIGKGLTTVGKGLTTTVTAPVVGFGAASVKAGADFDAAMSKVMAIGGDFGELQDKNSQELQRAAQAAGLQYQQMGSYAETAFNLVRQKAIQMGNDTKFTAEESADALYYMALAGWGGADMLDGLKGIMDLSAASGVDLARTSDIVTDALTAFGESADQSSRFANVLAATSANANTNVDLLGESFKYVGAVAGGYGYTLEDTSLALGLMANAGIKGTQAGTGLRQALKKLTDPTDENAALMDKYGITLHDAQGNILSLRESMAQWRESFAGIGVDLYNVDGSLKTGEQIMEEYGHSLPANEFEKLSAVASIFGTRALPGVLAIIDASEDDFNELMADIDGSSASFGGMGDAAYQASTMMDNLKGDWILFTSALGTAKIIISDMANGPLRKLVQSLKDIVTAFNTASPETQKFIVKMALIAASIGPVIFIIGKIVTLFSTFFANIKKIHAAITILQSGFNSLGIVLGGLSAPVVAIIAIVLALVAAFIHLWKTNENFRNSIISIWNNLVSSISTSIAKLRGHLSGLGTIIKNVLAGAKVVFDEFSKLLGPVFIAMFQKLADYISHLFDAVVDVIGLIVSLLNGDFSGAMDSAASLLRNIGYLMMSGITTLIQAIVGFFSQFVQFITTYGSSIVQMIASYLSAQFDFIVNSIASMLALIIVGIVNAFTYVVNGIKNIGTAIGKWYLDILSKTVTWVANFISNAVKAATGFYNNILNWLNKAKSFIAAVFLSIISAIVSWATNFISSALSAATGFYNNVSSWLSRAASYIGSIFNQIISRTLAWALNFVSKAVKAASDFKSKITSGMSSIPDAVGSIGADIVRGLWNGISGMGGWLWDKVRSFASGIIDAMKSAVKVGSPSKLAETEVGRWLPPGIAVGFEKALPSTMQKIEDSLNGAITDYNDNIKSFVIGSTFIDPSIVSNGMSGQVMSEMYWLLAQYIAEALRTVPIVNNVNVEMEDGDVIMDRERVGRSIAPIVSRIIAAGGG